MKGVRLSLLTLCLFACTLHTHGVCSDNEEIDVILTLDAKSIPVEFEEEEKTIPFRFSLHIENALPKLSQKHQFKRELWKSLEIGSVSPLKLPSGQNLSDHYYKPCHENKKIAAIPFFISGYDPFVRSIDYLQLTFLREKDPNNEPCRELQYICHNKSSIQLDFFVALGLKIPHVLPTWDQSSYQDIAVFPKKEALITSIQNAFTFIPLPNSDYLHQNRYALSDSPIERSSENYIPPPLATIFRFSKFQLNVTTTTPLFLSSREEVSEEATVFLEQIDLKTPLRCMQIKQQVPIEGEYISRTYLLECHTDQPCINMIAAPLLGDKTSGRPTLLECQSAKLQYFHAIKGKNQPIQTKSLAQKQTSLPYLSTCLLLEFEKVTSPTINTPSLDFDKTSSFVCVDTQLEFKKKKSQFTNSIDIYVVSLDSSNLQDQFPVRHMTVPSIETMLAVVSPTISPSTLQLSSTPSILTALENPSISLASAYLLRPCQATETILSKVTPFLDIIPTYAAKQAPLPTSCVNQAIASLENVHRPTKTSVRAPIFTDHGHGSKAKFDNFSPSSGICVVEKEAEPSPTTPVIKEEKLIASARVDLKHRTKAEPKVEQKVSPIYEATKKSHITLDPLPDETLASISKKQKKPASFFYSENDTLIDDQYLASGPQAPTTSQPSDLVKDVSQLYLPQSIPPSDGFADYKTTALLQQNAMTPFTIKEFDFEVTPPAMQPSKFIELSDSHLHLAFEPQPFILRENYDVETSEIREKRRMILQYLPVNFDEFQRIENLCFYEQFRTNIQTIPKKDGSGYLFSISLYPLNSLDITPQTQNYIFVIDQSRSVNNNRFNSYVRGVVKSLRYLKEGDTFNILLLKSKPELLSTNSLPWNKTNLAKARKYLSSITYNPLFSSPNPFKVIKKVRNLMKNSGSENTIIYLTNGKSFKDIESYQEELHQLLDKNQGQYTLNMATSSMQNNMGMLELLSTLNKGEFTYSQTNAAFPRKLAITVKHLGKLLGKEMHIYTSSDDREANIELYPLNTSAPNLYSDRPYVIYGSIDKLADFNLIIQGKVGEEYLHVKKRISLENISHRNYRLEKQVAFHKAQKAYYDYLEDENYDHLREAKELSQNFSLPTPLR